MNTREAGILGVTKLGTKVYGEGEAWRDYYVFPRCTEEEAANVLDRLDLSVGNGGPGQPFTRRPIVRHSRTRTLILQSGGLDV